MKRTPLVFVGTSDLAGVLRGKAFPVSQTEKWRLRGLGWVPANALITCFDSIDSSVSNARGELLLFPQPSTGVAVDLDSETLQLMLGNIVTLAGDRWVCCPRSQLESALERLDQVTGLRLLSSFEHEFQFLTDHSGGSQSYAFHSFERRRVFCEILMGALESASMLPESVIKEYGVGQFEVVVSPKIGVMAADDAVVLREISKHVGHSLGDRITFTPMRHKQDVGNGVHVHFSFLDGAGQPAMYDRNHAFGLSTLAGQFLAGVQKNMEVVAAFTAPSSISYERLRPGRWSAGYASLGIHDREATLRLCNIPEDGTPFVAADYNVEYRAADATANPYLVLAALVHAGVDGIELGLPAVSLTNEGLSGTPSKGMAASASRLPNSLKEALESVQASAVVQNWFGSEFVSTYLANKHAELNYASNLDLEARCSAYESIY